MCSTFYFEITARSDEQCLRFNLISWWPEQHHLCRHRAVNWFETVSVKLIIWYLHFFLITRCFFVFFYLFLFFWMPLLPFSRLQLQSPGHYSHLEAFYEDKRALLPPSGDAVVTALPANAWSAAINHSMHPEMKVGWTILFLKQLKWLFVLQ